MFRGPAAKGHPWPSAAIPASMPGCPLHNACVRPAWLTGRRDQHPPRGGLVADLVLGGTAFSLWERACPRRRPSSRPVSCGCTPIQLWERACPRRRPSSRPVTCGCTPIQLWERACPRRRPSSRPVSCGCTPIQLWERACPRRRPSSRPVSCGCTPIQRWERACSRRRRFSHISVRLAGLIASKLAPTFNLQ